MTIGKYLLIVIGIAAYLAGGCGKKPAAQGTVAPIMKVAVLIDGRITADGSPATIESLQESFKKLAEQKGSVWIYRETGRNAPSRQANQLMLAVNAAGVPFRLSSRPDYSDSLGPDGRPIQQ